MKNIYLDYVATTPVDPAVFAAMEPYYKERFGNPGSVHAFGQEAIAAVDRSREAIAQALGAEFRQVVFAGSATEANVLALRGTLLKFARSMPGTKKPRLIVSAIEHESVLETARAIERMGAELVIMPVDAHGLVDPLQVKKSLTPETVLVSVMYANNEIGTVQPIEAIAAVIKEFRAANATDGAAARLYPLLHTDAVQAFQFLPCMPQRLGVDLMTISAHKIYGPKGIGALFVRDHSLLAPIVTGGGQEYGLRSGTENVPAIVGFAKAVELAVAAREKESARIAALRVALWAGIKTIFPKAEANGGNGSSALPNILNVYFPDDEAQDLLTRLDKAGLAASSGSACRARAIQASYVIEALRYGKARAKKSVRFSLGRPTTAREIEAAIGMIKKASRTGRRNDESLAAAA